MTQGRNNEKMLWKIILRPKRETGQRKAKFDRLRQEQTWPIEI